MDEGFLPKCLNFRNGKVIEQQLPKETYFCDSFYITTASAKKNKRYNG